MATETVKDYLGHPCQIALAFDRFQDPVNEARKLDRSELVRSIGKALNELIARNEHMGNALALARDTLENPDTAEQVQALLEVTVPFDVETGNKLFWFAGQVLVALEQGKMVEVAHG